MILKGSQRSGGQQLAAHLLKAENEHVTVHEVRGFLSEDLHSAFHEIKAVSQATNCKQYLFSLSMNPPQTEQVTTEDFIKAADEIEQKLGLTDQPRAIVFHEKEGRRHAHVVWSRIDAENLKAINLPFYKNKLNEIAKEQYLEHGWELPNGFKDPLMKDPLNFNQAEWQQALRTGRDPREIKQVIQQAWQYSDDKKSLNAALEEYGYKLAQGDRRGFVAVDYKGEVYSLPKWAGIKTREAKARLGSHDDLPTVSEAKEQFEKSLTPKLKTIADNLKAEQANEMEFLNKQKHKMAQLHTHERNHLEQFHQYRWTEENQQRQDRYNKGLRGLLDRITGKHSEIKTQNELEAWNNLQRDKQELDSLIFEQLEQRQKLQHQIIELKKQQLQDRERLADDVGKALKFEKVREEIRKQFELTTQPRKNEKEIDFER
ncbi:MAG TPA: relaxase [Gammaproteobacteria bacterium]|nr:hypothetical protein [Xanthomonadales bacterium]MCB1595766.1 hypothetical protein [Xanthomonadales bacterium]HPI95834.1 relaxase [Gammaproteobacteria bacterium]HPQ87076.1 relaxase [Gammaproteobacteria bacterium]